jgi:hypothetical protein
MRSALLVTGVCAGVFLVSCSSTPEYLKDSPLFITELHFDPSTEQGEGDAEFVEIVNISSEPVDLTGWSMSGIGSFSFESGTVAPAEGAIVVCRDKAVCSELSPNEIPIAGVFDGKLSSKGEIITIEDPQGRIADAVQYTPELPEVEKASGSGLSIHRVDFTVGGGERAWKAGPTSPGEVRLRTRS